ncbi:MAG: ABC transporter substrate-binding protein, partial [Chloroflexota bacterium]
PWPGNDKQFLSLRGGRGEVRAPAAPAAALHALTLLLAACGSTAPPAPSAAAGKPLSQTQLRFAIPVSSGLQVLPEIAQQAGYFQDEGLAVTFTQVPGSQEVIAALNKGDLDMSNTDSPSTIQAHLSGIPTTILAVPVTKPIFDLIVPAGITKPEDLKGKTVAVTKVCDSNCFQLRLALQTWGLKAQDDVKLLGLGDFPGAYAGLTSGQVQGAMLAPPFNFQAQRAGYHALTDLSTLPINYPTAVVQSTEKFTAAHPDTVQAFMRAYVKAIQRYKSDKPFVTTIYRKFLKSDDTELLDNTWTFYQRLLQDDPTPSAEGIKFVLDNLAQLGAAEAAAAKPETFIQPAFAQQAKRLTFAPE